MKRFARLPLLLCACAALVVGSPAAASPAVSWRDAAPVAAESVTSDAEAYKSTIMTKVNELRASRGLQPLVRYQQLDSVAQGWSEHLAVSGGALYHNPSFSEQYPSGHRGGGENVVKDPTVGDVGTSMHEAWYGSPGHLENMLNPDWNAIGIGVAYDPVGKFWYGTQNFANYPDPAGAGLTETSSAAPQAPAAPKAEPRADDASQPGSSGFRSRPEEPSQGAANNKPEVSVSQPTPQPTQVKPDDKTSAPKAEAPATSGAKKSGSNRSAAPTDPNVIALPPTKSPTEGATAPVPAVAAPEDVQRPDGKDKSLPVTGVSMVYWALAVGLAGAGVVLLSARRLSGKKA